MKTIEKIRQKIEELYNGEAPKHDQQCNFDDGYFVGIDAIAQFLDTLESEKPMNLEEEQTCKEFEKEFRRFIKKEKKEEPDGSLPYYGDYGIYRIARHFAQWGKEQGYREGFLEGAKTQREEDNQLVDIIYQQGIEKGKDEIRETLKKEEKK